MAAENPLSHFVIAGPLGSGGMGHVYRARDTRLRREVALKFVSGDAIENADARRRLLQEAESAATLNHPGICTIHEVNEVLESIELAPGTVASAGTPFIAMELIEGRTLSEVLAEETTLRPDRALDIAGQMSQALAAAHAAGIVHRDLKPQNVMITPDGRVKILDFGLAKPLPTGPEVTPETLLTTSPLTEPGMIMGTVPYMSPEQASGKPVDSRSDVFSLGIILYEMLAGRRPFSGDTPAQILVRILEKDPEPLSTRRPDLPGDFERIVHRCLRKDPGDRYNDTRDLVAALQDLRSRSEAAAVPSSDPPRTSRGRRAWFWGAGFVLAALAALTVVWLSTRGLERISTPADSTGMSVAVADFRNLGSGDETTSAGMTELVNIGLVEASPIRVVSPEYLRDLRRRLFGSGRGRIEDDQALEVARKSGATLLLVGSIGGDEASRFVAWRLVDTRTGRSVGAGKQEGDALTVLADGIVEATSPVIGRVSGVEATGAPVQVGELSSESPEAFKYYMAGIVFEERTEMARARQEFERAVAIDSTFALAWFGLGRAMYLGGYLSVRRRIHDLSLATERVDKAWELREHLSVKDRMRVEAFRYGLEAKFERVTSILEAAIKRWPDDRQVLRDLVTRYYITWDRRKAAEWAEHGAILYPDDPYFVGDMYVLALGATGKGAAAVQAARRFLTLDPEDPDRWNTLGNAFLWMGEPDSAVAAFQVETKLSPEPDQSWVITCAYARGDLRSAIELSREEVANGSPAGKSLIRLLVMAGRHEEANRVLDAGIEGGVEDPGAVELTQGQMLLLLGRADEALALADDMSKRAEALALADDMSKRVETTRQNLYALRIRARALAALGKFSAAREAAAALHAGKLAVVEFVALDVDAEAAFGQGRPDSALVFLKRMRQQGAWYGGQDQHLREARARAYAMMGDLHAAAGAYEELLHIYGGDAPARYELAKVYQTLGRDGEAVAEYRRFLDLWAEADEGLPQLADAQSRLAALTGS